ncbi:MAG: hypothetical protein A2Y40_10925 [Candidatus Margulisbacteria bacterium GWF2_35_9]|nr:MAG: hypothetical protein A2Y40_10925 [Candidatus Margulisbacteria bacterium GWF2_35_9]
MEYNHKLARREDGNKYTFFIIDETDPSLQNITDIINHIGGEVVGGTTSGIDAINKIENTEADIFVIDILMPGIDELNVIPKIKDKNIDPHIIMVSESIDKSLMSDSFILGEKYFITKPYDSSQIFDIISRICNDIRDEKEDAAMLIWNKSKAVNVMIIEDSKLTTKLLRAHLEWFACNILATSCCGKEAIYELQKDPSKIDLIVMGLVQQDMKYDKLIYELISIRPDISIVVISATEKEEVIDKVRLLGAKGFISKTDFNQKKLYKILKKIYPH